MAGEAVGALTIVGAVVGEMVERRVEFALVLVGDIVVVTDSFLRAVHETLQIFCKLSDCSAVGPTAVSFLS